MKGLLGEEGQGGLSSAQCHVGATWGFFWLPAWGPDHWRQGYCAVATVQLQRGALRPGLSPGLLSPGSRPADGSQKGEEGQPVWAAACMWSPGLCAVTSSHTHSGQMGNRGLRPVPCPKPDSVGCTVVQAATPIPERTGRWCPQACLMSCW